MQLWEDFIVRKSILKKNSLPTESKTIVAVDFIRKKEKGFSVG